MATVRLHALARLDLIRLDNYMRRSDPDLADRFRRIFHRVASRYASQPHLGQPYDLAPASLPGLRFTPIGRFRKHLMIYRPRTDGIEVLRVVHGMQDPTGLLDDPTLGHSP